MPATSSNSRTSHINRGRLPLTPKVTSNRRGGHAVSRRASAPVEAAPAPTTPAMHITPNVVIAARGRVATGSDNRLSDAFNAGALDMRGLRL